MSPHLEQKTQEVKLVAPFEVEWLLQTLWPFYEANQRAVFEQGEFVGNVEDGVIFIRKKSLSKWPEHDKSPEKKRQDRIVDK